MTAISDLLERVEKATGPDREIDRELYFMSECEKIPDIGIVADWVRLGHRIMPGDSGIYYHRGSVPTDGSMAPTYTASIDAALALVERKLPGWAIEQITWGEDVVIAALGNYGAGDAYRSEFGEHKMPAFAILTALLRALESETPA